MRMYSESHRYSFFISEGRQHSPWLMKNVLEPRTLTAAYLSCSRTKNSHSRTKDTREAQHREVCRRRNAAEPLLLYLGFLSVQMDFAVWSTRSTMGFCRPESHLLHSRRTRSAIPREPLARPGGGGLLRTDRACSHYS